MWFDFRVIGATSILLTLCMSELCLKGKRRVLFFSRFKRFPSSFFPPVFEKVLSTLIFEWREKDGKGTESNNSCNRETGVVYWRQKRNARPRSHCVTHRARAISFHWVTNIPPTIFSRFFSSKKFLISCRC